jgi:hypothetical protein
MSSQAKQRETYTVQDVYCLNCGWNENPNRSGHGLSAEIPKGVSVPAHKCPECGCEKLWKER